MLKKSKLKAVLHKFLKNKEQIACHGRWCIFYKDSNIVFRYKKKTIFIVSPNTKTITIENDDDIIRMVTYIDEVSSEFPGYKWIGDYADYYLHYNEIYNTYLEEQETLKTIQRMKFDEALAESKAQLIREKDGQYKMEFM